MPQLNPHPWFMIFLFTWIIFLTILPNKIYKHTYTNKPSINITLPKLNNWNWPWI
uniref:ATP synthase complex subunit 8 n=1 Tax=Callorhinchus capensis TaxID=765184 RepID=D7RWR8_CALCG|nr:ATP synthase F0 subunit 8 [Callorhinchus capensis]ADI57818.1 ATP synthase F0 subunit 8 [Callorhinchus capensis]